MAILSVIRRWHLRDGVSIREIARRSKLSRNTIRKYLASAVVEPKYPRRKSPSKLDGFAAKLTAWLVAEARKGRKQRRNLRRLYADLAALGFQGSYDRVAAFARSWRQTQQEVARTAGRGTFVPLMLCPGRGVPVRLERGLGGGGRRAHQVPGGAVQAELQPGVLPARLSAADARDAVRRARPCVCRAGRRAAPRHLRQHEDGGGPGPAWARRAMSTGASPRW